MWQTSGQHHHSPIDAVIDDRYRILSLAGKGNFASVYKARDLKTGGNVAVKMLGWDYVEDAKTEKMMLKHILEADKKGNKKIIRLRASFMWRDKCCLVMQLLGPSLSKRRFGVKPGFVKRQEVQNLAKQMAETLTFLHGRCALIHTDLKPDNILVDDPSSPGLGNSWTIGDFGNSAFHIEGRDGTSLITTRPYRSPEVLTKKGWKHPTDMWSLGCILYEVYIGKPLFGVSSGDALHISLITEKLGAIPGVNYPAPYPPVKTSYLENHVGHDSEFLDLLKGLLTYQPMKRLRAKEMCKHPFVLNLHSVKQESGHLTGGLVCGSHVPPPPIISRGTSYAMEVTA
eukprot:TRINITY_DN24971_c0_g1_i1.p1 TRINITY_DN24971_c0_g1~~TRINITY_DN24971_c0_g1_i1.p1  ORF type:complete len:342 (+),score=42.25 TRINITY_DN24971_c0_g1_i1:91-1116(+)